MDNKKTFTMTVQGDLTLDSLEGALAAFSKVRVPKSASIRMQKTSTGDTSLTVEWDPNQ